MAGGGGIGRRIRTRAVGGDCDKWAPDLSDITEPVVETVVDIVLAPTKAITKGLSSQLGVTPLQLKIGAGVAVGVVALAVLAPYARMLSPRGRK